MLNDKGKYAQGWRGQFPPYNYQSLNNPIRENYEDIKTPQIPQIVASKLKHVSPIEKMPIGEFQAPVIDESKCLQCGRCYLACSDSGYQAIQFDGYNTVPRIVEEDCTGCAICHAACPVENAIHMKPRTMPYTVNRGTMPSPTYPKEHLRTYPPSKFQ